MGVFWRAERFGLFSRKKYSAKSHKYRESAKQKEREVEGYYHNFAQLSSIPTELDVPSCQMQPSLRSKMYHCIWSRHTYNLLYLQTRAHLYTGKSTAPIATGPKKLINNFPPPPPQSNKRCIITTQNYQQALYPEVAKRTGRMKRVHRVLTLSS